MRSIEWFPRGIKRLKRTTEEKEAIVKKRLEEYEREEKYFDYHNTFIPEILECLEMKDLDESCHATIKKMAEYDKGDLVKYITADLNKVLEEKNLKKKKEIRDDVVRRIKMLLTTIEIKEK